ncbi:MAG TPA: tetratricopeptide repeat protein, partial [Tangfeifania sp.]|nr:tetratricopeptide repeat protein [Tangfeifania sp.]
MLTKKQILLTILTILIFYLDAVNQNINPDSIKAKETFEEAINYYRETDYFNAIDLFNESLFYNIKLHGDKNEHTGNIYNALGIAYRNVGNYNKAIENFQLAEQSFLATSAENKLAFARIYNNIGNVYLNSLDHKTALNYYQRAINIFEQQDNIDK